VTGAIVGALLVGFTKSWLSEQFPQTWLFLLGLMFIASVGLLPNGIAGGIQRLFSSKERA
jgi:urea transport system permease protein